MRSAARMPSEEPPPERAGLDAKAQAVLDGQMELVSRATALLAGCPDALLLRQLITETIAGGLHCEELRSDMARYVAASSADDDKFRAGYAAGLRAAEQAATAAAPGPRHARGTARYRPGEGQRALFSVKTIPGIAAAVVAVRTLGRAHRLAAALAAVTIPFAAGAGTYAALQPGVTGTASPPAASAPNPAASIVAAAPVPSQSLAALTKPKAKHAARGKELLPASSLPVPSLPVTEPSLSSPSSSQPSVQVSVQAGPAVLTVSTSSLDLSGGVSQTFTITASGGGFASWHVDSTGPDLDFSPSSGVLEAGESATVTVSVDAAQALDGNLSATFSISTGPGSVVQSVTVSLPPLPVPVPAVSVSVPPLVPSPSSS